MATDNTATSFFFLFFSFVCIPLGSRWWLRAHCGDVERVDGDVGRCDGCDGGVGQWKRFFFGARYYNANWFTSGNQNAIEGLKCQRHEKLSGQLCIWIFILPKSDAYEKDADLCVDSPPSLQFSMRWKPMEVLWKTGGRMVFSHGFHTVFAALNGV